MTTVLPFVRNISDFDDEETGVRGEAFDAACKGLRDTGQPALVREIIARRIIKAATKGERDPVRLRNAGLAALGYDGEAIEAASRCSAGRRLVPQGTSGKPCHMTVGTE